FAREMLDIPEMTHPPETDRDSDEVRIEYAHESAPMTMMPPPGTLKELVKTAGKLIRGEKSTVLVDKIGERLAFERTGVRLYEGVLEKFDAYGSWKGGPTRAQLAELHDEELSHFHLLVEAMGELGSDATAMTPSANLVANMSLGLPKVIADPRTDLRQCLEAIMVAELADNASWESLIDLARAMEQDELVERFEMALAAEHRHLRRVKGWLTTAMRTDAFLGRQKPAKATNHGNGRDQRGLMRKRAMAAKVSKRRR
ncbi:MAG: ferritin-like domain-containing protein, partial [Myxococcaceae bacterium]|nr:ferritin-like domain-containing protein [Myxococcaceae bacterium]